MSTVQKPQPASFHLDHTISLKLISLGLCADERHSESDDYITARAKAADVGIRQLRVSRIPGRSSEEIRRGNTRTGIFFSAFGQPSATEVDRPLRPSSRSMSHRVEQNVDGECVGFH